MDAQLIASGSRILLILSGSSGLSYLLGNMIFHDTFVH